MNSKDKLLGLPSENSLEAKYLMKYTGPEKDRLQGMTEYQKLENNLLRKTTNNFGIQRNQKSNDNQGAQRDQQESS
jgi:hypothetical protein